ncbi:MAG TPA: DNA-binding response regulator [Lentisphaeria bacterium]|nr:MAG: DNA-binding response regulator [Lentisphaerae bacterium GWF2_49_21]HBC88428.1 DNA-binding response regulator [Lentisphaeria bacterium]
MKKITILLADDHSVVREGFRMLLELAGDFEVVGEAVNGLQALKMAKELHPAVVVMDLAMPQLNGIEAAKRILQEIPPPNTPKILILSAHADDAYIEQIAAIGVKGYLVKQSSSQILCKAIKEIHKGNVFYSPSIANRPCGQQQETSRRRGEPARKDAIQLTSRESEVLQLVAEGRANKEIAEDLGISIKTVEKHRQSTMNKLKIHDTAGLTRYAISKGIVESSVQSTILK